MGANTAKRHMNGSCPIRDVLDRIGDQWSTLVLEALAGETLRFNELKREIGDVSQHMLARTLRRLEQDGLVSRTFYPVIPPRVDYALTPLGRSLLEPIQALTGWARTNHASIIAAREKYRERVSTDA
ncbi:HxlR family transcriptional regulator [Rhizobium subbaraonis]|uniref:HxlR family transcriptional regulator n=1 Tax=Rhizobium subbaraonis TaxID=908946 RepID=A0A285U5U8_9HYPH|nr:helix-turn-helix domain-containing protein [Rhizobium subbaraonis]SOC37219.1 HxlR family transcriptional regulator [Rhizobium subbaraonis]